MLVVLALFRLDFFRATVFGAALRTVFALAAASAFCLRQRAFVAAIIRFIPSGLIRRFGFGGSGVADPASVAASPLCLAYLAFWAADIRRLTAAENCRRLPAEPSALMVRSSGLPPSIRSTSWICSLIVCSWLLKPARAARSKGSEIRDGMSIYDFTQYSICYVTGPGVL